jgi:hypothetical protein
MPLHRGYVLVVAVVARRSLLLGVRTSSCKTSSGNCKPWSRRKATGSAHTHVGLHNNRKMSETEPPAGNTDVRNVYITSAVLADDRNLGLSNGTQQNSEWEQERCLSPKLDLRWHFECPIASVAHLLQQVDSIQLAEERQQQLLLLDTRLKPGSCFSAWWNSCESKSFASPPPPAGSRGAGRPNRLEIST